MDDITKSKIEKEIEDFVSNLFEKYKDLRVVYFDKYMRPVEENFPPKHVSFSIYRRHMTEDEKFKVNYHIN